MAKKKTEPKRYTRASGLLSKQVTINGKRKVFYGHSDAEITQKMLEYKGEAAAGPMFSNVADSWWSVKDTEIRRGTVSCYKPCLNRAKKFFNGKRISEISAIDVSRFLAGMKSQGLAEKTIGNAHCVLTMIFEYWCGTISAARCWPKACRGWG